MPITPSSRRSAASIAALAAAWFALAPSAMAGDWYVDAAANCAKGDGSPEHPYCKIDEATAAASNGDTVHVAAGTYAGLNHNQKSLTIVGTSGSAATFINSSLWGIQAAISLHLSGFTFRFGGLNFIAPADVTLEDCVFDGSMGASTHVVWMIPGCSLVAEDCTFRVGQIACDGADLTLVDCLVRNNYNNQDDGGALHALNSTVQLTRTQVRNSQANNRGGGLYVEGGSLDLVDCTIANCTAGLGWPNPPGQGGGMTVRAATATATGTSFDANQATPVYSVREYSYGGGCALLDGATLVADRCTFTDNVAVYRGGAVYADATSAFTAVDCPFVSNSAGNGGAISTTNTTLTRCRFERNVAPAYPGPYAPNPGVAGACHVLFSVSATDCQFIDNESFPGGLWGAGTAGLFAAAAVVTRCEFSGNVAHANPTMDGGSAAAFALFEHWSGSPPSLFTDCVIVGNVAEASANDGGVAAGGMINCKRADFVRCTIAGNVAQSPAGPSTSGATGGGLAFGSYGFGIMTLVLDHTIVAGNVAARGGPDIYGLSHTVTTLGWNCIGDTTDVTITGSGPNDLLDVDPLFADAANGDWSLDPSSPCIDSGDPVVLPSGKDVAGFPRLLDGDLDKKLEVDRGGLEFSHVRLAITGVATPGGTITIASTGTTGMAAVLIAGVGENELPLGKLGALFIDLSQLNMIVAWPPLESSVDVDIDPALPVPMTLYVQELAVASGAGNLSNVVRLDLE